MVNATLLCDHLGGDWGAQSFPKNPRQKEMVRKNTDGGTMPYFFGFKIVIILFFSECHKIWYIVKLVLRVFMV